MAHIGKVTGIYVYSNDVVVRRNGDPPDVEEHTRGEVTEFSKASRKRLAFVASNTPVVFTSMLTLTYPAEYPTDGEKVKRDLQAMLDWLRRDQANPDYLWFLEFQARGAPHLHILLDIVWPRSREDVRALRFRAAATWYRIVGSEDRKHLAAGTQFAKLRSPRGGAHYAVKYAHKMRQKWVPPDYRNVGRFWGHSRRVKPEVQAVYRCTEDDIRGTLEHWRYYRGDDFPVYKVLYNQAAAFTAHINGTFDTDSFPQYNPAQPDWSKRFHDKAEEED